MLKLSLPRKRSLKFISRLKDPRKRILYLYALYSSVYDSNEEKLIGLLDIVDGLEYHFKKVLFVEKRLQKKLTPLNAVEPASKEMIELYVKIRESGFPSMSPISHELTAYFNRLGQIYYFLTSPWIHDVLCNQGCAYDKDRNKRRGDASRIKKNCKVNRMIGEKIPTILGVLIVRHKFTSHRSIDNPMHLDNPEEDSNDYGFNVAGIKLELVGQIGEYHKMQFQVSFNFSKKNRNLFLNEFHVKPIEDLEHFSDDKERMLICFKPTNIHSVLMSEIFDFIGIFLSKSCS